MSDFSRTIRIDAPIERVFHFHDDTANLVKITPASIGVEILGIGAPGLGNEIALRITQFGFLRTTWVVRITAYEPPAMMVDEQLRGPFKRWVQTRRFRSVNGGTELTDEVQYALPFGWLGSIADTLVVRRMIASMFAYRQRKTKELLEA